MTAANAGGRARPVVAHYREYFPVLSETFIRETIVNHRRYDPVVFTHDRSTGDTGTIRIREAGVRRRGPMRWLTPLRIARRGALLREAFLSESTEIVHAHFGSEGVTAMRPARALGIPLVVAFYGYDATALARQGLWHYRFRRLFQNAAAVLAEGPVMAERLTALGADPSRLIVHPIPIRMELFPFRPPAVPAAGESLVLLQACRFVRKKGVDLTIMAFARIATAVPSAVLWLLGSGPEEARLRNLAIDTGLGERIRFLPAAPHAEYAATLRCAHIFVHPSRTAPNGDAEGGAPTAILEAQALGLPIVATTHDDIPSSVDPDAALLAAPGDVAGLAQLLLRMIRSPREWSRRAEAGHRHVSMRHDPQRLAAVLEDLYDQLRGEGR